MPIKFRCPHCQQFLGISRSRAGVVTDCPMCGRSIRVPLLDGSVEPLPEPELNLQDHGLASALDKLASLVSGEQSANTDDDEPRSPEPIRSVSAAAPQPIPLPEPIVLQPAPVPVVSEPPAAGGSRSTESQPAGSADPLGALAAAGAEKWAPNMRPSNSNGPTRGMLAVAGTLIAVVAFVAGYFAGQHSVPKEATGTVAAVAPVEEASHPDQAPNPAAAEPPLGGRIQYVDATGESRADAGARVLLLPEERTGSAKLSTGGFRAGADAQDRQLAIASIQAIGGDFAIADDEGAYHLNVPQAGLYQLIILSRYQPRPESEPAPASVLQFLGQYFDRPVQVIGDAAVYSSQFRYRGTGTSERDHSFEAP